jgi:hypothetical protein
MTAVIVMLDASGFGDGDVACPGDVGSGQARPAATVTAWLPRGGTLVPALREGFGVGLGVGAGVGVDVGAVVTGGADVTDGEPPIRSLDMADAEPASTDGASLRPVLAGADGTPDGCPDGVGPA